MHFVARHVGNLRVNPAYRRCLFPLLDKSSHQMELSVESFRRTQHAQTTIEDRHDLRTLLSFSM
jgi:hypothetical protein